MINKLVKTGCDTVITVQEIEHPPHWMLRLTEEDKVERFFTELDDLTRRQEAPDLYLPNGAVFVTRSRILLQEDRVRGEDTRAVIMPSERSVDIDKKLDLLLAEKLLEEGIC